MRNHDIVSTASGFEYNISKIPSLSLHILILKIQMHQLAVVLLKILLPRCDYLKKSL